MFVFHRCLDIVDGRICHAASLENVQPFLGGFGSCDGLDQTFDEDAVFHSFAVRDETRVRGPFGSAELGAQKTEKTFVSATKEDITIKRLEPRIRYNRGYISSEMSAGQ